MGTYDAQFVSITDGDTLRLHLEREMPLVPGWATTLHSTHPRGVPVRLIILDTPERGQEGWHAARDDLTTWVLARQEVLRCDVYESAGWDRVLGDLYNAEDRGDTATQHMLRLGWPHYLRKS